MFDRCLPDVLRQGRQWQAACQQSVNGQSIVLGYRDTLPLLLVRPGIRM